MNKQNKAWKKHVVPVLLDSGCTKKDIKYAKKQFKNIHDRTRYCIACIHIDGSPRQIAKVLNLSLIHSGEVNDK